MSKQDELKLVAKFMGCLKDNTVIFMKKENVTDKIDNALAFLVTGYLGTLKLIIEELNNLCDDKKLKQKLDKVICEINGFFKRVNGENEFYE